MHCLRVLDDIPIHHLWYKIIMHIFIFVENLTLLNNLHYGSICIFLSWKGTNKLQHRFDKYEIIQLFPVTRHEVLSIVKHLWHQVVVLVEFGNFV